MNEETTLTMLYDHYYNLAEKEGRADIDASIYAYEQACSDMRELTKAELRAHMRKLGIL